MLELLFNRLFNFRSNLKEPPYVHDFLISLDKKEYPEYLKKIYFYVTGEKLNLRNPKTLGEKIQYLKLYDTTELKTKLTDKILVRDYIAEKIGKDYLKPVLQVCENYDSIDFQTLPEKFIIKCNHGCKWFYIIKNKKEFLQNSNLINYLKKKFDFWMSQNFAFYSGFELQYEHITPKIIIEEFLRENDDVTNDEYEIFCFNGEPKLFQKIKYTSPVTCTVYNNDFSISEIKFQSSFFSKVDPPDNFLKEAVILSKKLAETFKFVRIDWMTYKNKLYFNEMTFTPQSGFFEFEDIDMNKKLGKMLKIK